MAVVQHADDHIAVARAQAFVDNEQVAAFDAGIFQAVTIDLDIVDRVRMFTYIIIQADPVFLIIRPGTFKSGMDPKPGKRPAGADLAHLIDLNDHRLLSLLRQVYFLQLLFG